ncbi:MAG: hypothetical protein K0M45_09400 [Candidatus Paracaedibacteraceae bacterium]|nr:hypothetical protein [Candidatus Paracaedibacteraceae bacterium]
MKKNILMGLFLLTTAHAMDAYQPPLLTIKNHTPVQLEFTIKACGSDNYGSFEGQAFPHSVPQRTAPEQTLHFYKTDLFSEYQRNCSVTNFEIIAFTDKDSFKISEYILVGSTLKLEPTTDQNSYKLLLTNRYEQTSESFIKPMK